MALSYIEIIGANYPGVQVHCTGDPNVYSNITLVAGSLPSKAQLDADIAAFQPPVIPSMLQTFSWSLATANNLSWLSPMLATDTKSGYLILFNATVVGVTGHCANANGNTGNVRLFVNSVDKGTIGTFSGSGERTFTSTALNININAGDKLRLQIQGLGLLQTLSSVLIELYVKWR